MMQTLVSQVRYLPYGETRWSSGVMPTDRRCIGQREEVALAGGQWSSKGIPPAAGNSMVAAPSQRDL